MARYRIGNDMTILWTVNDRDGKALPLSDKEVHLYYTCERGRFEANIEIQYPNVIVWNFLGSSQRALGDYTLTLEILQSNGKRVIRRDICNAFTFVGKSCEGRHGNEDGEINNDGVINLVSELEIYRISPIIPYVVKDENGIGYWYVDGVNTGDRSTGESAYEYAKKKGYEGTEDQFAEKLAEFPDWNIVDSFAGGYIKNRSHGVTLWRRSWRGTVSELTGGVMGQYAVVFHDPTEEIMTRHLYLNGNVVFPKLGKEYKVRSYALNIDAKLQVSDMGGYDLMMKAPYDTGEIIQLAMVDISQIGDAYIPDAILRVEDIDSALSTTSENPVMNKVITKELEKKANSSDLATINGQRIDEGGNIEIEGKNYDAEIEARNVGSVDIEGCPQAPDAPNVGIYDDTEIRSELAILSDRVDELDGQGTTRKGQNTNNPDCPDPCIWKGDDGWFYIKSTGRVSPFTVKRTIDFKTFEDTGRTFISQDAMSWILENIPNQEYPDTPHFWAPQVLKINNRWVLYLSIVARNGDNTGHSSIIALTSRTYAGDFGNPVEICSSLDNYLLVNGKNGATSSFGLKQIIDPYVYCDFASNKLCLLAGSSYGIYRFNLNESGLYLDNREITLVAGKTIEVDPTRESVCEGAFLYARPHNGKTYYYLFSSTGDYRKPNYRIVVGRSSKQSAQTNPSAPYAVYFSDKSQGYSNNMREGKFEVVIQTDPNVLQHLTTDGDGCVVGNSNNSLWGPGHVGGIIEDKNGKTYILYHCHNTTWEGGRKLFVQELFWDESGWPFVESGYPKDSYNIPAQIITSTQTM